MPMGLMPNTSRKTGTMTMPPPMPRRPEKMPMTTPTSAAAINRAIAEPTNRAMEGYSLTFRRISLVVPASTLNSDGIV